MRRLSFLMALFVLFLATTGASVCDDTCPEPCQQLSAADNDSHSDAATGCCDCCSPFLACATCVGFVIVKPVSICRSLPKQPRQTIAYQNKAVLSDFYYSIWHPPKQA